MRDPESRRTSSGASPREELLAGILKVLWSFSKYIVNVTSSSREARLRIKVALICGFTLNIYFHTTTGGYGFTLVKAGRVIMRWDNAPHHPYISTYPHHLHDENGEIKPSDLVGNPILDLPKVMVRVVDILSKRCV